MTYYSYGWQPSPPDIRDHVYAMTVSGPLPPAVDLARPTIGAPWEPVWSQGAIGSCGPHTACADIVFAWMRQDGLTAPASMPSRLFVYYVTRLLMGTPNQDSGVQNRAMLKALARYGWCDESLWPYIPSRFTERPPLECFNQAQTRRITEYLSVPQTLDQMKGCLASGDPFIFGFSVYSSLESAEVARTGIVPLPRAGERMVGGHDVLMCGYSDETQRFKFRNSWGSGWGQQGYGEIPYAYAVNPRLASDFWTVKHSGMPKPPTPPEPPAPAPSMPTLTVAGTLSAGTYTLTRTDG